MTGLGTIYVPNTTDPAAIAKFAALGLTPGDPFPNNTIPASLIDPVAAAYIKAGYFAAAQRRRPGNITFHRPTPTPIITKKSPASITSSTRSSPYSAT